MIFVPKRLAVEPLQRHWRCRENPGGRRTAIRPMNAIVPVSISIIAALMLSSAVADTVTVEGERRQAAEALHALLDAYFEDRLRHEPMLATAIGDHRYDDRYPVTIDPGIRQAELDRQREYLRAAGEIDPELLGKDDRVSLLIFRWDRSMAVEGFSFPSHLMPMNQLQSPANDFVQLGSGSSFQPFATVRDYDNWLSRTDGFVDWMDQAIENMREGIHRQIVLPRVLVVKMIPQVAAQVVDSADESLFFAPIRNMPAEVAKAQGERLTAAYREAITQRLMPAYRRLAAFLEEEYLPAARQTFGYLALPDGEAWYAYRVRLNTTSSLTAEQIHELGLYEVERIHAEIRTAVMDRVDFDGELMDFFEFMNTDTRFYFDRREQLLDGYRALRAPVQAGARPLFHRLPLLDYEIRAVEPFRERSAAGAQYQPPDPAGSRPGVFFVNTFDLSARPSWAMEALFLHEAIPGHHLQNALRIEMTSLPRFRRFSGYTAYGEGWALYAESLGHDIGVFRDPYQYFGKLASELWRAIRLVVDTGIHYKGWSRQEVLDYMYANAPVKPARAISEAERFMAIPGQALAYKVGQLKILEFRARAEAAQGEKFDVRDFHSIVLDDGPMPMGLLEDRIDAWIRETGAGQDTER